MARWHIVVPDEFAGRVAEHLDGRPLSAFVRRAVEQALGRVSGDESQAGATSSDRRVGSRTPEARPSVPSPAPAEQPQVVRAAVDAIQSQGSAEMPGTSPAGFSRVRSSSAARPFRPVPKGKP